MKIVYAKGPVRVVDHSGAALHHPAGSHWPADDPYVRANPDLFSDDPRYYLSFSETKDWYLDPAASEPSDVESATAAPGEKRNVRRT
jgi:hypothetical protein